MEPDVIFGGFGRAQCGFGSPRWLRESPSVALGGQVEPIWSLTSSMTWRCLQYRGGFGDFGDCGFGGFAGFGGFGWLWERFWWLSVALGEPSWCKSCWESSGSRFRHWWLWRLWWLWVALGERLWWLWVALGEPNRAGSRVAIDIGDVAVVALGGFGRAAVVALGGFGRAKSC